jgi:hypothetical protein
MTGCRDRVRHAAGPTLSCRFVSLCSRKPARVALAKGCDLDAVEGYRRTAPPGHVVVVAWCSSAAASPTGVIVHSMNVTGASLSLRTSWATREAPERRSSIG